ncbi:MULTISPECIES: pentapeptide repeat-containing protein [unclassified Clostridium]|uniref:pentapeptide repeat-containing protein n=1 Tax=unclassified Clostridium TaxID=2614128 RepID=UPI000297BC68|nr:MULTISPECIES: pentapeptide repeat-containing protein [unclassified Clostridium]EKQ54425.1 MAG: putative low-complexity protein [Clostridium sp. Maddingley MBC34-26]
MAVNRSAPESFYYDNAEKTNKNFIYKNLKRSKCYNCNFSNSNFDYASLRGAHFKKCNFFRCSFKGAEFIGSNLKGCKFKEAKFEDTIFEGANLDSADFIDAKFKNTLFVSCDISKAKNLSENTKGIRVFESMPELEINDDLKELILSLMENEFIKKSRIFDTKDGDINTLTLMILREKFNEETLMEGLHYIKYEINRDFHTLSYIIRLIQNM